MSKKVILHGKCRDLETYVITCKYCGCMFTFTNEDVSTMVLREGVVCPECFSVLDVSGKRERYWGS